MSDFPRIFAHRGASSLAPENTIAAFAKAAEIGARWCELDLGVMADGTLIVIHDDTVDRTTNSSGRWENWGYSELRRLDAGAWFSPTYRFERIPELADVVSFANGSRMGLNVELKPCPAGERRDTLLENVGVALQSLADPERLIVSSFDPELLAAFHAQFPHIALGGLCTRDVVRSGQWRMASELGCMAIHPENEGLTSEDVAQMREAGFEVNVWTVNDVERARELASWGVSGIFTDVPQDFPREALARV